jgi:pimeloyl-ACP methyl ester carboxylesterase
MKPRSRLFRFFKWVFLGLVALVLLLAAFVGWLYVTRFSGPAAMDLNAYHPFRSEKARADFLAMEQAAAKAWPVAGEERTVKTSFGTTFMRVSGPADAPPLVLLPGGGSTSLIWKANVAGLSTAHRVYALDQIYDFGQSIYTREIRTGADFAAWLDELFDVLQLGPSVRVGGYSYGGFVATQYALAHPERTARLVLVAPAGTVLPIPGPTIARMALSLMPVRGLVSYVMYWVWDDLARAGPTGKALVEERIDFVLQATGAFKFKQGVNPYVLSDDELASLKVPVLFLVGEHEKIYDSQAVVARLKKVNPGIKTELIPGTGHDLMFTHTERVNAQVLEFLK